MSKRILWTIAGTAMVAVVFAVSFATLFAPKTSDAEPAPSVTASATAGAAPSSTPTSTPPAPEVVAATCENTSTIDFRARTASLGWVSWTGEETGREFSPFAAFPNGSPQGELTCTWGADPNVGTDNVVTLAWAPIDSESAVAAMQSLEASGYTRIDEAEGIYLAMEGEGEGPFGPAVSPDGYAQAYLFTTDDVRWAAYKAEVAYVKAPTEAD